jgi:integration host factor subunit alpha
MALNGKTLTRADLAEAVFEKVGLPRNEAAELVESVLKQIVYALERGEAIKLSSFGSFGLRQKSERVGRNPKTGEVVPITPRQVIVFKASNIMKDRINATLSKPVKPSEAEKPAAGGKSAKSPKADKSAKPSKVEKPAKPAKSTKPGNSAKPPKSNSEKKPAPSSRRDA